MTLIAALKSLVIEPPANLLLLVAVGLALAADTARRSRRRRVGLWLAAGGFGGLVALSLPVVSWLLLVALERGMVLEPAEGAAPGAIVILAGDDLRAVPGGIVAPPDIGPLTLQRLRAGVLLHRRTGLPILVAGVVREGDPPIARAMARVLAEEYDVIPRWVEDRSVNTWENAAFAAALLGEDGIAAAFVVTHSWHMRRSLLAFARTGLTATAAPTHFTGPRPDLAAFVPNAQAWAASNEALHEWIGLVWYSCGRGAETMRVFADATALPEGMAARLFGGGGFFSTAIWWRTVWAAGVPPRGTPLFALAGEGDEAVLFALLRRADGRIEALTNPYTCLYQPMAGGAAAAELEAGALKAAGRALGRLATGGVMRLEALDPDWPGLAPLLAGARTTGLVALRFDHFGNWHEAVGGRDWRGYLATRPGALRETVRRRLRDAERHAGLSFAVLAAPGEMAAGIAEYEAVYARSWKEPEPFPRFNAALMVQAAAAGMLRLGVLRLDGAAIAVQLWVVHEGVASVLKLAHDEAHKPLSPGTVLSAWMIRRLIEEERIAEIDFGRGDDPYKQLWTSARRQRIGVLLARPWHPAGLAALLRHAAGRLRRHAAGRLRRIAAPGRASAPPTRR